MRWLRLSNNSSSGCYQEPELLKISPIDTGSDFQALSSLPTTTTTTAATAESTSPSVTLFKAKSVTTLNVDSDAFGVSHDADDDDDSQRKSFTEFLQLHSEQG